MNPLYFKPIHGVAALPFCAAKNEQVKFKLNVNFAPIEFNKSLLPIWVMQDRGERYNTSVKLFKEDNEQQNNATYFLKIDCQGSGIFKINAKNMQIDWQASGTDSAHYFQTLGLALWLELKNILCIHANALAYKNKAIALVAPSRTGKTTLTAALSQQGFALMTDDMMALHHDNVKDEYTIYPSWPVARMWPDSLESLMGDSSELCDKVHQKFEKRIVEIGKSKTISFCDSPKRLQTIYVLQRYETAPDSANASKISGYCEITEIQAAEALIILLQNSILGSAYNALGMEQKRVVALSKLLEKVHFKKVCFSSGKSNLLNVCQAIKEDFVN